MREFGGHAAAPMSAARERRLLVAQPCLRRRCLATSGKLDRAAPDEQPDQRQCRAIHNRRISGAMAHGTRAGLLIRGGDGRYFFPLLSAFTLAAALVPLPWDRRYFSFTTPLMPFLFPSRGPWPVYPGKPVMSASAVYKSSLFIWSRLLPWRRNALSVDRSVTSGPTRTLHPCRAISPQPILGLCFIAMMSLKLRPVSRVECALHQALRSRVHPARCQHGLAGHRTPRTIPDAHRVQLDAISQSVELIGAWRSR